MNPSTYTLTTDHATSSYGIPVLVDDEGNAYGPFDTLPSGECAAEWVARWMRFQERTEEDLEAGWAFVGQAGIEPPPTFAYYTEEGIWSTGATPEEAIENYLQDARADREDFGEMKTAPMTPRLARQVERHGFNCKYDSYTILKDGRLDKVEEPSDASDDEPHTEVTSK